jgi:hypothetical protein
LVKGAKDEGELEGGDPVEFAYLAWTMVHGVANLAITGRLPQRTKSGILKFATLVIDQSLPVATVTGFDPTIDVELHRRSEPFYPSGFSITTQ